VFALLRASDAELRWVNTVLQRLVSLDTALFSSAELRQLHRSCRARGRAQRTAAGGHGGRGKRSGKGGGGVTGGSKGKGKGKSGVHATTSAKVLPRPEILVTQEACTLQAGADVADEGGWTAAEPKDKSRR